MVLIQMIALAGALAFGLPDTPEVPETPDVPEIPTLDIPGIAVLEEAAEELEGLSASLEGLVDIIPEVAVLDETAAKLREYSDLDAEAAVLLDEIETYRAQLVEARDRLEEVRADIDARTAGIREQVESVRTELEALVR
jgi:chromosome segregation ATPase